jgi:hypothetical protein
MVTNFRNSAFLIISRNANLANTTASKSSPARVRFPGHPSYKRSDVQALPRPDSFIWDVYDAVLYQSAGFVVHGLACLAIFAFSFVSPLSLSLSLSLADCVRVNLER